MHRLHSHSTVRRFRFAAFLYCVKFVLLLVAVGVLVHSVYDNDHELTLIGIGWVALAVLVLVLQWFIAARTHCPLCITPVLASKQCEKHHRAKTTFGSHRVRVALAILFQNSFCCPYCNESTVLESRRNRND